MKTFYFNTGVRPQWHPHPGLVIPATCTKGMVLRGGTKQIPFDADVPENAIFMYGCDDPNHLEGKSPNVIVARLENTILLSKYGYFRIVTPVPK